MGERDDSKREIAKARERMSRIAVELSRRATPEYVKGQAKMIAKQKSVEAGDRFVESPWALGLVGGVLGAFLGKMLGERTRERLLQSEHFSPSHPYREGEWTGGYGGYTGYGAYSAQGYPSGYGAGTTGVAYGSPAYGSGEVGSADLSGATYAGGSSIPQGSVGTGQFASGEVGASGAGYGAGEFSGQYAGDTGGYGAAGFDEAQGSGEGVKEKLGHMKDRISERTSGVVHGVKDRMPHVREHLPTMHEAKMSAYERPWVWALGAAAVGALFASLVPITSRERRVLAPAKGKVQDRMRDASDRMIDKAKEIGHEVQEKVGLGGEAQQPGYEGGQVGGYNASGESGAGNIGAGFNEPGGDYTRH
jgi:ElaB/YqjD/DUF883 family membrane-anchored ribosome-binding protein